MKNGILTSDLLILDELSCMSIVILLEDNNTCENSGCFEPADDMSQTH
jgi:hypothetical protein